MDKCYVVTAYDEYGYQFVLGVYDHPSIAVRDGEEFLNEWFDRNDPNMRLDIPSYVVYRLTQDGTYEKAAWFDIQKIPMNVRVR